MMMLQNGCPESSILNKWVHETTVLTTHRLKEIIFPQKLKSSTLDQKLVSRLCCILKLC